MKVKVFLAALTVLSAVSCAGLKNGTHRLVVLSTGDVHGRWFDSTWTDGKVRGSLLAAGNYIKEERKRSGKDRVLLLDAGDQLDGNEAAFFFNRFAADQPHLFPRMAAWMQYDAVVPGHADFGQGHEVYDRVIRELETEGIAVLAANVAGPGFSDCRIFRKDGLKVAVLGFANSATPSMVDAAAVSGLRFTDLMACAQQKVDSVIAAERPQVVVVVAHTGLGKGDGRKPDQQGMDLFRSLRGVDLVIAAHDHRAQVEKSDSSCLIDGGRYCGELGKGEITVTVNKGKVASKTVSAEIVRIAPDSVDTEMRDAFRKDFLAVRSFVQMPVGELRDSLRSRDAYRGSCAYSNLYHAIVLDSEAADISFHAPLAIDGVLAPGSLSYGDLAKLYPFANSLLVLRMTGAEVKAYLEKSYDNWIVTMEQPSDPVLNMKSLAIGGKEKWNFANSPGNFDSAGGLHYTVDVTKPCGERISIAGLADGRSFEPEAWYRVAVTTYRSSGSGKMLQAAGLDPKAMEDRVVLRGPEYKELLFRYLRKHPLLEASMLGDPAIVGTWKFIPEAQVQGAFDRDLGRVLGN